MAIPDGLGARHVASFKESSSTTGQVAQVVCNADGTSAGVPEYTTVACGELQGSATALQLPTVSCKLVKFKASAANTGNVYIGKSGVTKPDATTDTTTGLQLAPSDDSGWLPITNLNLLYRICDNATDALTYIVLS